MNTLKSWKQRLTFGCLVGLLFFNCTGSNKQNETLGHPEKAPFRVAFEWILEKEEEVDMMISILVDSTDLEVYHWKNHVFLWGLPQDTTGLDELAKKLPIDFEQKIYHDPFYAFDLDTHCDAASKTEKWKNYLLTANLVKDSLMQQEYMNYHQIQFQEWPEVSQGFCNAEFQQLLLFRNGRQLLLVISVPADKTLDELNPKTTENNPRVEEWNVIMSQYQEGIKGTDEGEVWVFLKEN